MSYLRTTQARVQGERYARVIQQELDEAQRRRDAPVISSAFQSALRAWLDYITGNFGGRQNAQVPRPNRVPPEPAAAVGEVALEVLNPHQR